MKTGRILFFPYYAYLHLEAFNRVIACLESLGCDSECVYIPYGQDRSPIAAPAIEPGRWRELRISTPAAGIRVLSRLTTVPSVMIARAQIRRFLGAERPSLVVVGSDLGDRHIRLLLDGCTRLGIPVLIVATVGETNRAVQFTTAPLPVPAWLLSVLRPALHCAGLERAMLFSGQTIGSYQPSATIAVPGQAMKDYLVGEGIHAERIAVTGSPLHDGLYEVAAAPDGEIRRAVCDQLDLSAESRLVVYCTERVQDLYGTDYMVEINRGLAAALTKLPADYRLIIKLHPRESAADEAVYRQMFSDNRFRVVRAVDNLYALLHAADVVVSHISATLVDAAVLGTPTLSINVKQDRSRLIFGENHSHLYIFSMDEVVSKVVGLISDPVFGREATRQRDAWRQHYACAVDGKASYRIASLAVRTMSSAAGPVA